MYANEESDLSCERVQNTGGGSSLLHVSHRVGVTGNVIIK